MALMEGRIFVCGLLLYDSPLFFAAVVFSRTLCLSASLFAACLLVCMTRLVRASEACATGAWSLSVGACKLHGSRAGTIKWILKRALRLAYIEHDGIHF